MAYNMRLDVLYTVVLTPNYLEKLASFKGYAKSVSSRNVEGVFDVLPMHENFVTIIKDQILIYDLEGRKYEFKVAKGLLEASNNLVKIFLEF